MVVFDRMKSSFKCAGELQNIAGALIAGQLYETALTLLCSALVLEPGRVSAIHDIGKCLEALGETEDASSCYRGAIPDSLNSKYFSAASIQSFIKSVKDCEKVIRLKSFDEERKSLSAPLRNLAGKSYGQFRYTETHAREAFCTVAEQGFVWFDGVNTLAMDCKRQVISEQVKGNVHPAYHSISSAKNCQLNGTACFLDGRSSAIYYHWMLDILPKLGLVSDCGLMLDEIDHFIVAANSRFQLATLKALGIEANRIVYADDTCFYQAEKMIVPCLKNDQGDKIYHGLGVGLSSHVVKFLKNSFLEETTGDQIASTRVYISRLARGSRNIANEPALVAALKLRGFETVQFELLTVEEQAELMSRVDVVIGVHGAGLTNLAFCKPGTRVIEIFGDYIVPCYWALSAVADLDYAQFMAKSVNTNNASDNPAERVVQLRDMAVDIDVDDFIGFVDRTLETSNAAA